MTGGRRRVICVLCRLLYPGSPRPRFGPRLGRFFLHPSILTRTTQRGARGMVWYNADVTCGVLGFGCMMTKGSMATVALSTVGSRVLVVAWCRAPRELGDYLAMVSSSWGYGEMDRIRRP